MTLKKQIYFIFSGTIIVIIVIMLILQLINQRVYYSIGKVINSNYSEQRVTERMVTRVENMFFLLEHIEDVRNSDGKVFVNTFIREFRSEIELLKEATEKGKELAQDRNDDEEEEDEEEELAQITEIECILSDMEQHWENYRTGVADYSDFIQSVLIALQDPVMNLKNDASEEFLEEFAEIEELRQFAATSVWWITIITGLVLTATAIRMGLGFSIPVGFLSEATKRVMNGDLNYKIPYTAKNELGDLANSFNEMSSRLSETTVTLDSVEAIIESIGNGIVVLDHDNRIKQLNPKTTELLNINRDEVVGREFNEFIVSQEESNEVQRIDYMISELQEIRLIAKGKDWIPVGAIITRINRDTDHTGLVIVLQDLRPFKESERALIEVKNQAESANYMKSVFLANMSHEIRTPMNGVNAVADLLLDTELKDNQRSFVETIKTSSDNLLALINELLDLSKIESGKMELNYEEVHLWKLVESCLSMFSTQAHTKGLDLLIDISPNVPQVVQLDTVRFRQILVNLLGNALKFTATGFVLQRVSCVEGDEHEMTLRFETIDTGIGIAKNDFTTIFDTFKQVDSGLARKSKGTGLGLSISSKLMALMDSELQLESVVDHGSRFYFDVKVKVGATLKPGHQEAVGIVGKTIYSVCSNPIERPIIKGIFNRFGIHSIGFGKLTELLDSKEINEVTHVWLDCDSSLKTEDLETLLQRMDKTGQLWLAHKPEELNSYTFKFPEDQRIKRLNKPIFPSEIGSILFGKQKNEVVPARKELAKKDHFSGKHVLVVDDDKINRNIAALILKKLGFIVDRSCDGFEAIKTARNNNYDFIFMDIQMPEMDGFEATKRIRTFEKENGCNGGTKIIACTAHAVVGYRELCLEHGMDGYVSKPIKVDSVFDELSRVQQGKHLSLS